MLQRHTLNTEEPTTFVVVKTNAEKVNPLLKIAQTALH